MKKRFKSKFFQKLVLVLRTNAGVKVVLFFLSVLLISSLVVYEIERGQNEGFESFFDSFWWTIVTVSTVGYGDRFPVSPWGRTVAMVIILAGIGITATVTGRIASFLMERQMKEEKGLLDYFTMSGHFIICGWKREMDLVLYHILETNPGLNPMEIVIITRASPEQMNLIRNDNKLKGIKFVNGDYIEEKDLKRAGVKNAASVLVFADYLAQGDFQQIDSKTVMAVMSIKNLNKKAYVCAELLDIKFEKYLKLSHCDEVLLSRDFSRSILANASSGAGLSHVVKVLLSKRSENAHLETLTFPASFIAKTYGELKAFYEEQGTQLIGLLENTGNILIRKTEALREAQKNPDISSLIPEIKSVKNLSANDPVINPPREYAIKKYTRAIVIAGTTQLEPTLAS